MQRIVVCLDGSPLAEMCIPDAVRIARTFGSALTLLTVLPSRSDRERDRGAGALEWELTKREAEAYLQRIGGDTARATGLKVDLRVEQGHPAERIVAASHDLGADLTVIGSHGESGLTAWVLGGTARQVLSELRGSVLVGRSTPRTPSPAEARPRILVPLDGTARAEFVLPTVSRLAKAGDAEVILVHVVSEPNAMPMLESESDLALARELSRRVEARAKRYLEHLRSELSSEGTRASVRVLRHSDERESLLDAVGREGVDLVVLSAHGSTCDPSRAFGTVSEHIVARSSVPVLVVQDLVDDEQERPSHASREQAAPPLRATFTPENG